MSRKTKNNPCVVKKSQQWDAIKAAVEALEETGSALGATLAEWAESARINGCDTFKSVGRDGTAEFCDFSDTEGYHSETIDDMCKGCWALATFDQNIPSDYILDGVTQEDAEAAQLAILKQCL